MNFLRKIQRFYEGLTASEFGDCERERLRFLQRETIAFFVNFIGFYFLKERYDENNGVQWQKGILDVFL